MICYTLKCPQDHRFDSWFQSSAAFERLAAAGLIACPACGASDVTKSVMAPRLRPPGSGVHPDPAEPQRPLSAPASAKEAAHRQALAEMKAKIEASSDYVGMEFVREARAIHAGDAPERAIYGEARPDEAKALIEEGVPVAPLPFLPARKTN